MRLCRTWDGHLSFVIRSHENYGERVERHKEIKRRKQNRESKREKMARTIEIFKHFRSRMDHGIRVPRGNLYCSEVARIAPEDFIEMSGNVSFKNKLFLCQNSKYKHNQESC